MSLRIFAGTFFMANSYFQFKQFRVEQSLAAMKVCTEACLFGALADFTNPDRILDIGTGTGLLSLMLAQQYSCPIDAVEIEENAYLQAKINFEKSPWNRNLNAYHSSIQEFTVSTSERYDFIISNPPFFSDHLKASNSAKNIALHNNALSQIDLLMSVKSLLTASGELTLLLPPFEAGKFDELAKKNKLFLLKRTAIFNSPGSLPFRFISHYGYLSKEIYLENLYIRNSRGEYSEAFKLLLKPYYLFL